MAIAAVSRSRAPLGEINTTPLIDVMLVLLVMVILTIPISTNTLPYDLPNGDGATVSQVKNVLVVTDRDQLLWNGAEISDAQLAATLAEVRITRPEPEIQFRPEANSSYDRTAKVLQVVKASGVTRFGFAGNEQYRVFGRGP